MDQPRWRLRAFVALQVGIPAALLAIRAATGERLLYGWGWQMFS